MEHTVGIIAVLLCILAAAAISRRIQGTIITLPMVYTTLGLLIGSYGLGLVNMELDNQFLHIIAELTLVMVLASDAARIDVRMLRRDHVLPSRLLGIGLLLTMIFGTLVAYAMFGKLGFWGAAVLAIILAPTDASLGQAVITNPSVPVRIRQTLNIESGLNDGIAMPFLLLAISLALSSEERQSAWEFLAFTIIAIVVGIAVGAAVGWLGAKFVLWGARSGWMSGGFRKISGLALILLAYSLANLVGGNGYIAAFVMGMVAGDVWRNADTKDEVNKHVEVEVSLLILLTFLLFGAVIVPKAIPTISSMAVIYALLSLTLIRMIPVAISLIGSGVKPITVAFLGWFGPRGTASILYIFTVLGAEELVGTELIYDVAMITVLFSIFLHGITAAPAAKYYGRWMAKTDIKQPDAAEHQTVPEMPLRSPGMKRM